MRRFKAALCAAMLLPMTQAWTQAPQPGSRLPQPAISTIAPSFSIGAYAGFPMVLSSPQSLYNYSDYSPPGLGLRYGIAGMLQFRASHIVRSSPDFSIIGEVRYANIFNSSDFSGSPPSSTNASYSLLSFGFGVEQAINTGGRASPYFGLTVDVNEIAPGSLTTTTKDSLGNQSSASSDLTGSVWQLRFGVTPRIGVITRLSNALSLDVSLHYQAVNLVNRADQTPKNKLLDPFGNEPLISQMNAFIGVTWTLPVRGR